MMAYMPSLILIGMLSFIFATIGYYGANSLKMVLGSFWDSTIEYPS